jgi:YcaO-like protein with predicted kinase domain
VTAVQFDPAITRNRFAGRGAAAPLVVPPAAPPIMFRGRPLRGAKVFVDGTHRCARPDETLARIRPHFARTGLTRLADITGLDRIGVTTVISYRPNSRTLATSAGKGFTLEAALVSGAMEAIELWHAENLLLPKVHAPYDDLPNYGHVIALQDIPLAKRSLFRTSRREIWVPGWDLLGQREVYAPYFSVSMITHPRQWPYISRPFVVNSNGLASGNELLEAVCAALLEVIERDAVSCHEICERRHGYHIPRVRLETVDQPLVLDLLDRFRRAKIGVVLYDCTTDTDVPVYMATIYDEQNRHIGMAGGYGAHLDPEIAMVRALTEAAQSRLVWISGARDDLFRHDDRHCRMEDSAERIARLEAVPPTVDARARRPQTRGSFEEDVALLLDKLRGVGVEQVLLFDLTHEDLGIPVARVVVPGLEGYLSRQYTAGRRAKAFCRAYAEQGGAVS